MTRHWSRAIVSLGVVSVALASACGGDSSDTEAPLGGDAGGKDGTASGGDDSASPPFGGDDDGGDATLADDAEDATGSADDASDSGSAAGDGASDATGDSGDDGAALSDAGADGGDSGSSGGGVDAGPTDGGPGDGGSQHGADGGPDGSAPDGGPAPSDGGACNFAGTWGAEITMDVTWAAGGFFDIVIAPGSGTIKQWLLSTRTQSGTTVTDTAFVCGIDLPDFQGSALVNETYGIRFPDSLFDDGGLTSFAIGGTVSGSTPTATYTTTPTAVLLGLTLPNAATAVWPASITTEVDEDNDKKPGITANVVPPGGGYAYVPLDFTVVTSPTTVARADLLYLAIRQVTSVNAQFTDCDHASGSVTVPQITDPSNPTSKKYAIDSHVIGCSVNGSGTDCAAGQTTFVDENQPVFVPSATTFTSARLAAGATCATVRGQFH
ncbi:MAG TPA: hypothetical protein VK762_28370 [Polyangiaceae bacterium]|jgi:hypothetical protein|nr:hypothetical protein [Polyangiaceae bacterium]